jgi:hypothetical protein
VSAEETTERDDDRLSSPAEAVATLEHLLATLDRAPDPALVDAPDEATPRSGATAAEAPNLLSALETLRHLRDELARWEPRLIGAARERGVSWAEIAPAVGVASRQAAERRYLRLNPHASAPELTGEQRVQAARDRRAGDRAVADWARDNSGALRRLAGQIAALEGLDPSLRAAADKVQEALGLDDTAALLAPLAEVGNQLAATHPALASQLDQLAADTDQIRLTSQSRTDPGRGGTSRSVPVDNPEEDTP